MSDKLIGRIKPGSIKQRGASTSFEIEQVPEELAIREAMVNAGKIMQRMYDADPTAFRWTTFSIGADGKATKTIHE